LCGDRFGARMKPSHASSEAAGLRAPRTRRRPSAVARCSIVAAAVLAGAVAPGTAKAAGIVQLANVADQIEAATWSQATGTGTAETSTADVAKTVAQVTDAALSSAGVDVVDEPVVAGQADAVGRGRSPQATRREPAQRVPRARSREKARPRDAAAAASPTLLPQPAQVEPPVSPEPRSSARDRGERKRSEPGAARESRAPSLPLHLPDLPLPLAMPYSVGAGSGGGSPVPLLLVALTAAISLFVTEVLIRRVPSRRPVRPRRIVLPPWRPG
jgi:hypothetical protein